MVPNCVPRVILKLEQDLSEVMSDKKEDQKVTERKLAIQLE